MRHTLRLWCGYEEVCKVTVQTRLLCSAGMLCVYVPGLWGSETLGGGLRGQVLRNAGLTSAIAQVLQCDTGCEQALGDSLSRQNLIAQILRALSQGCGSVAIARLFSNFGCISELYAQGLIVFVMGYCSNLSVRSS